MTPLRFLRLALSVLLVVGLFGCAGSPADSATSPERAAPAEPSTEITILYTADEHGWILPHEADGQRRGGASQLLAQLVRDEQHCAGALAHTKLTGAMPGLAGATAPLAPAPAATASPQAPADPCTGSSSVLLSGGDNVAGPTISGYYRGGSMAVAMGRLGYAASAFGNHEFDYGQRAYLANRDLAGMSYLAANMVREQGGDHGITKPYVVIERAGRKLGVIGLATRNTLQVAMASRFVGLRFDDEEATLSRLIPELRATGVDAVVVLIHDCARRLVPMVARHPEWQLAFVGAAHCHQARIDQAGDTLVVSPGWRLNHYARIKLRIPGDANGHAEVAAVDLVPVASPLAEPPVTVDPALDAQIERWKGEVDAAMGEVIGHNGTELAARSHQLGGWVVRAWRTQLDVDVALTTTGAIRQELPVGPIRLSAVYSILPFENALVISKIPGRALGEMLRQPNAIAAGIERKPDGSVVLAGGGVIEADRLYTVVSSDFLYEGGDGFPLRKLDPQGRYTAIDWRTPVIQWTKAQQTDEKHPLDAVLRE